MTFETIVCQLYESIGVYVNIGVKTMYTLTFLSYLILKYVFGVALNCCRTLKKRSSTVAFAVFYVFALALVRRISGWATFHPSVAILCAGLPASFFLRRHLNALLICTIGHMEWEMYELLHQPAFADHAGDATLVKDADDTIATYALFFFGSVLCRLMLYVWEVAIVYENIQTDLTAANVNVMRAAISTAMPMFQHENLAPVNFSSFQFPVTQQGTPLPEKPKPTVS
jgi:hypothetical protein